MQRLVFYDDTAANTSQKTVNRSGRRQLTHGTTDEKVAQLYGQVRTDWNQCFVIDCSLSHPAGHKPFTFSHSVVRNT